MYCVLIRNVVTNGRQPFCGDPTIHLFHHQRPLDDVFALVRTSFSKSIKALKVIQLNPE